MSVRKPVFRLIYLSIALMALAGCVPYPAVAPTPMPMLSPQASPDAMLAISPLPSPVVAATKAPRTSGMGSLWGELERLDGTPLKGILIYPALIEDHSGVAFAAVDPLNDVHVETDARGHFSVDNLAPGEYALAMQSPVGIIMPHNREGEIVKFKIEADGETALGRLAVGFAFPDNE